MEEKAQIVFVVIPVKNQESSIGGVVQSVIDRFPKDAKLEVIVVDDGSTDQTAKQAADAGANVLSLGNGQPGNPAIARNRGVAASHGDPIVFLDSDCIPPKGWPDDPLRIHHQGIEVVGGSLALPPGLSFTARCDYYGGWYHPKRNAGFAKQHLPGKLSVRRSAFESTQGFFERHPIAYSGEELYWQAQIRKHRGKIYFQPSAIVDHINRPGFRNLLRRNYRWGYIKIQTEAETACARFALAYQFPVLLILASMPLAP